MLLPTRARSLDDGQLKGLVDRGVLARKVAVDALAECQKLERELARGNEARSPRSCEKCPERSAVGYVPLEDIDSSPRRLKAETGR
jgi:hypothetical protein